MYNLKESRISRNTESEGAQLMSDATQLKGFKEVVVIPVVFTATGGEELELQSILDSNESLTQRMKPMRIAWTQAISVWW